MRRFVLLAEKFRVPLLLHAEGEPEVVNGMKSLLEYKTGSEGHLGSQLQAELRGDHTANTYPLL